MRSNLVAEHSLWDERAEVVGRRAFSREKPSEKAVLVAARTDSPTASPRKNRYDQQPRATTITIFSHSGLQHKRQGYSRRRLSQPDARCALPKDRLNLPQNNAPPRFEPPTRFASRHVDTIGTRVRLQPESSPQNHRPARADRCQMGAVLSIHQLAARRCRCAPALPAAQPGAGRTWTSADTGIAGPHPIRGSA